MGRIKQIFFLKRLYSKEIPQMGSLLAIGQYANVLILLAQILNDATQYFPSLAGNHWFVMFQAVLAAILPSVGGIAHKLQGTEIVPKAK